MDVIEQSFQSLEGKSGDNIDLLSWLSSHDDTDITRSSMQRTITVPETRLNYTGTV